MTTTSTRVVRTHQTTPGSIQTMAARALRIATMHSRGGRNCLWEEGAKEMAR